ncbi:uncharacterized protein LOC103369872 [Stegastes partitus]|uniref:Uncharacterized protein LOC103369872 n=1 Tax=Stegastes partitus TaxID=144197 RepID=A0A9Y4TX26_9TELE|nr:PREDICTED: uncharacterized protein LOC103369872 [Stegastes partitus]
MDGIDDCYVWQRRIAHGTRHQKGAVPFPESVKIGLEFNAALERKDKLDRSLLTNGVMLEISNFARTVTKSEKYFLFEMLEFNFDLGVDVDNGQQCYAYSLRVHNKIKQLKEQIKLKASRWKEVFTLPDPSFTSASAGSEVLRQYFPKHNTTVDVSLLSDSSQNRQRADSSSSHLTRKRGVRAKRTEEAYPFCAALGVTLAVRPNQAAKQKLDQNLLTNGVMLELLDFSRELCGTHTRMVFDLVKQNFGFEMNKLLFRMQLNRTVERRNTCLTAEDKDAFCKELFRFQPEKKRAKRKKPDADEQEVEILTSRRRRTLRQRSDAGEPWEDDDDLSYMCPVDSEPETMSGAYAGPSDVTLDMCWSDAETDLSENVKQEEEEVFISPTLLQSPGYKSEGLRSDAEKEKLWQRRADRTNKILTFTRVNDLFVHCRQIGLDFNVGSHKKQNLDLRLFTNWVLWEVYKFGTAMKNSLRHFLLEILHNNFQLPPQDEAQERNFLIYMATRERVLQKHSDRQNMEFLCRPFKFPQVYNVSSSLKDVTTEQQEVPQAADETHPFCKMIGLNLWSTGERPANQKLHLAVLTSGAVMEMFSFVRLLRGNVHDTVSDVLEHNFDLDLQSGRTEVAQVIQRWFMTQQSLMKKQRFLKANRWLNTAVPLSRPSLSGIDPNTDDSEPDSKPVSGGEQQQNRAYSICQQIGLDLDISRKPEAKAKLDLQVLTRAVLFEVHQYVEQNCNRYVPALYEILEYNFDLSSQSHRRVEFAWSIASQVIAMAAKHGRRGGYLDAVFQLPFEGGEAAQVGCKDEPQDDSDQPDLSEDADVMFVRKLKPVDIEVEID